MKKLIIFFAVLSLAGCTPAPQKQKETQIPAGNAVYTCPMHPEVKTGKPGICPKCGMDLTIKEN